MITIAEQSDIFLERLQNRRRRPPKPATMTAYRGYVKNWIAPIAGGTGLDVFQNGLMRKFVAALVEKGLGPKSVLEIVSLTKQIIASATNEEGEELYPRKWNTEFLDLPDLGGQKRPCLTLEQMNKAVRDKDFGVFYAFLGGTGLRIGEALAARYGPDGSHTAWDPQKAVLDVRTSMWRGQEQAPKTAAAVREVDLDPRLNEVLVRYTAGKTMPAGTLLFPVKQSSARFRLKRLQLPGFHAFRRFRTTRLREVGVSEDIIRYWIGHAGQGITDRYSKLAENITLRQQWAQRAGLGFDLPKIKEEA